jgi:hypothetical protein
VENSLAENTNNPRLTLDVFLVDMADIAKRVLRAFQKLVFLATFKIKRARNKAADDLPTNHSLRLSLRRPAPWPT